MHQSPTGSASVTERTLLGDADAIAALGPITLIGHSHLWCIVRAFGETPPANIRIIDLWKIAQPMRMDEASAIEGLAEPLSGTVISVIGGTRFDALAMYRHPRPFDFISPLEPDAPLDAGAELLPYGAVRSTVLDLVAHNLTLIKVVQKLSPAQFAHVESPPMWGVERRAEDWAKTPLIKLLNPTDQFGFRYLRRKIYRVHCAIVREFCAEQGIQLITPPEAAYDFEGFIKPEFNDDLIHANAAYGALMAEKILQTIALTQR